METMRIIEVNHGIFDLNDQVAAQVRALNHEKHRHMINIMASPGAGKTTLLMKTIEALKGTMRIAVMEADIDASVDAEKMQAAGVAAVQVHTGGECAMDAEMTLQALRAWDSGDVDLLFLENVGNLVCPAETDTGADDRVVLLSVPEGDDKPLKYPLMFEVADLVLITKTDTQAYFTFDAERVIKNIRMRNDHAKILFLSAKTGEGMEAWIRWICERMA